VAVFRNRADASENTEALTLPVHNRDFGRHDCCVNRIDVRDSLVKNANVPILRGRVRTLPLPS